MYKVKIEMSSPICFTERPVFDSILAYCWMKEHFSSQMRYHALHIEEDTIIDFRGKIPLDYTEGYHGFFLSSYMCSNTEIPSSSFWRKSWDSDNDDISDFQGKRRKVAIGEGEFKSYLIPLSTFVSPEVWFYIECKPEQIHEISYLLHAHLIGIGKKVNQGFGWWKRIDISLCEWRDIQKMRPIPMIPGEPGDYHYCGFRPPYWHPANMGLCSIPRQETLR